MCVTRAHGAAGWDGGSRSAGGGGFGGGWCPMAVAGASMAVGRRQTSVRLVLLGVYTLWVRSDRVRITTGVARVTHQP